MPDYQKAKIYKLWSPSKNIIYFGSTTQAISQRLGEHLSNYKKYNNDNTKKYMSSFLVLDCEDYKIELLEEYACNNKQQLEKKEGEYIKNNECVNKRVAGRTNDEYMKYYRENNVEKLRERAKQFKEKNPDKIKEYNRKYRLKKKLEKE
jgi:hypothetical protein